MAMVGATGSLYARFGKRLTAYSQMQSWRAKNAAASQQFLADSAALSSGITAAQQSYINGMGTIIGQMAMTRIQKAAQEKLAALNKLA